MPGFARLRAGAGAVVFGLVAGPVSLSVAEPAPVQSLMGLEAAVARLEAPIAPSRLAFDMAVLNDALPDGAAISFETLAPDPASGAARFGNVVLRTSEANDPLSVTIGEMLVWDGDSAALGARFDGKRLDETVTLFKRLELRDVRWSNTALNEGSGAAQAAPGTMQIGRVVFDGLTLHPWTYKRPVPAAMVDQADDAENGLEAVRVVSAVLRAVSFDSVGFFDITTIASAVENGVEARFSQVYCAQNVEGYERGNLAAIYAEGQNLEIAFPAGFMPGAANSEATPSPPLRMTIAQGYSEWSGLSLGRLLAYGERGEVPAISDTDLLSLGTGRLEDTSLTINDREIFSLESATMSADAFTWFFPQKLDVSYDGLVIGYADAIAFVSDIAPEADASTAAIMAGLPAILARHELARPASSGGFTLSWDPASGAASLAARGTTQNFLDSATRLDFQAPAFGELKPHFGADGRSPDEAALTVLFEERFALIGGALDITDLGGFDRIAGLAIDVAKLAPPEQAQAKALAGQSPESLRLMASGFVRLGGVEVSKAFPEATAWVNSLAEFVAKGGKFSVRIAPPVPLGAAYASALESNPPSSIAEGLGLTVTHTPP